MASIKMKVGELIENPQTCAIVEKYLPGLSTNPTTKACLKMSMKQLCGFPQANMTKEKTAALDAELAEIE